MTQTKSQKSNNSTKYATTAEYLLVRALVENPRHITKVLDSSIFYNENTKKLCDAIREQYDRNSNISSFDFYADPNGDDLQDYYFDVLGETPDAEFSAYSIPNYIAAIKKQRHQERFNEILKHATSTNDENGYNIAFNAANELFQQFQNDLSKTHEYIPMSGMMGEFAESLNGRETQGIPTQFDRLNAFIAEGGFPKGELTTIGARPGNGKTEMLIELARHTALSGHYGAFFSLEMSAFQLMQRWAMYHGISAAELKSLTSERLNDVWDEMFNVDNFVIKDNIYSLDEISNEIKVLHTLGKCDIAFIDYVQLVDVRNTGNRPRYEIVGEITRTLKLLAKKLNIPIICACQLSRDAEKDKQRRIPTKADLRESGNIEQDSAIVMLMHRPSEIEGMDADVRDLWKDYLILNVDKVRNGQPTKIILQHDGRMKHFVQADNSPDLDNLNLTMTNGFSFSKL